MCPRINEVVITLNLSSFFDKSLSEPDSDDQVRAFFLFYLLFSSAPCIKAKYIKSLKSSRTNILLTITLQEILLINRFLIKFFLEHNSKIDLRKSKVVQKKLIGNKFTIHSSCEVTKFVDVNHFLNKILMHFTAKESVFDINFTFINFPPHLNKINLIQNQFLFWTT